MKDLSTTSSDLFNKIRSRFTDIKIGDEQGAVTTDPTQARFFDVTYTVNGEDLGQVNLKVDNTSLTVIYNEGMLDGHTDDVRHDWYRFLKDIRQFARRNMLTFDTRDITKSNLDKRDYAYLAQASGENNMSESKLFGTSKTSYQDIGEAKIIVKHSQPVNYNIPAGRTQHIESIYIESSNGERFRYPTRHLNGARAMATHVANGGNPYDSIGGYITGLSEEMSKLRQFKNYTQRAGVMAEALGDLPSKVAERLENLKSEVASLQKQGYYESFRESFQPSESQEVPEEMASQWVDALTIKSFNEELKAVFPYIYKLVAEKNELTYDDLVAEDDENFRDNPVYKIIVDVIDDLHGKADANPERFKQAVRAEVLPFAKENPERFEKMYKAAYNSFYHIQPNDEDDEEDYTDYTMRQGELGSPDRFRGEDKEHSMFDEFVSQVEELATPEFDQEAETVEPQQSAITQEVMEFIQSMYDAQTGTFPRGEEGVKIACEKKFGEQAGKFAHYVVEKLSSQGCGTIEEGDINELDYSSYTSSDDLKDLRDAIDNNIVVSVAFVKKDGSVKHMGIKKNLSAYVPSSREKTDRQLNVEQNNDIKKVVDINAYIKKLKELKATGMEEAQAKAEAAKGAWRSINLKNVLGFMVKGKFVDLRDENEIQQRFGDEIYNSVTPAMRSVLAQSQQASKNAEAAVSEVEEARAGADNFTADDLHDLEKMNDIEQVKSRAIELIMTPSKRPMKPEKINYFKTKIAAMRSKLDVIKLMYDLLLSGEGYGVVGSRNSMRSNSYRQRFGDSVETESDELASLKELASQLDELSPKTLSSYAKKAVDPSSEKSAANLASRAASKLAADGEDDGDADDRKAYNRSKGVSQAVDRLAKLAGL